MKFYFDYFYNPVYDFIVTQLSPYQRLQVASIEKLGLVEGDKILCAGVGTGNEIIRILETTPHISITGIDSSKTALKKAQQKASKRGKTIVTNLGDIQCMEFGDAGFDKALCVHVVDFVPDYSKAVSEIIRVLKPGGKFAITIPSGKEDFSFGMNVFKDSVRTNVRARKYYRVPLVFASMLLSSAVYSPFLFRKERREYSREEIEKLCASLPVERLSIEDFPLYNDFIISGYKSGGGK